MIEIYLVMIFMVIAALVTVCLQGLLSSIIAAGIVGLGVCVMFLLLRAPDLAITQLVVEILMLVIMIRATVGRGVSRVKDRASIWIFISFFVFSIFFLYGVYVFIKQMPLFGQPLMGVSQHYVENSLSKTGASNIVAGIILDFRAYDTLGEATILFTSVIGVLVLMRKKGRKKIDERDEPDC